MKKSKLFRSFFSLIAIVIILLTSGSTQNAHAQFGLFDTVWTMRNQEIYFTSSNDSLLFLYGSKDSSIYLVKTLNPLDTVWWSSTYPLSNSPRKFLNNDTEILFDTWDRANETHYYKVVDKETFVTIDSVFYNWSSYPYSGCLMYREGISEVDTSIYYGGYCGATDIKASTYKVNYRTGQATITTDSLPYFAMTISEDGQYVAGVYYTGGEGTNVPYKEIIEVRKISDYSLVFKEVSKYSDYTPNFTPYQWVTKYKFKFSKDNKYLLKHVNYQGFLIYCIETSETIFLNTTGIIPCKSFSSDSKTFFYERDIDNKIEYHLFDLEQKIDRIVQNIPEYPLIIGGSEGFIFNDNYLLAGATSIYPTNYSNFKQFGPTLMKLNFDLTSFQETDNQIQGTLYPNPTNNSINLTFNLKTPIQLNYSIYSETGQLIKLLLDEFTNPGPITKSFDVSDLPNGPYFLKISGADFGLTFKVMIMR